MGVCREDAPATIRAFGLATGRLSIEELVDRHPIRSRPVRDLIVDYLHERQPSLVYTSLDAVPRTPAGPFWTRIDALSPGIDFLRLPPALARAWKKTDIATRKRTTTGPYGTAVEVASPRLNAKDELIRVRAAYLDIAHWAAEEPTRWAPWVVPCPISDEEISNAKDRKHRKARMEQRTRERRPLTVLTDTVDLRRRIAAEPSDLYRTKESRIDRAHLLGEVGGDAEDFTHRHGTATGGRKIRLSLPRPQERNHRDAL